MTNPSWHALTAADAVAALASDPVRGLSPAEAARRLAEHGPNRLPRARQLGVLRILGENVANPIALVLIAAAAISFAVGHLVDAAVLGIVIVLNIGFAVVQEYKASQAIDRILALIDYRARVVRGGREIDVSSDDVVPGDVLLLTQGMKAPADARLIDAAELALGEASLTGESEAVRKDPATLPGTTAVADRANMVFLGTTVDAGTGRALVVATGIRTELGAIVEVTRTLREPQTPLQEKLARLARGLTLILLVAGAVIFIVLTFRGLPAIEAFTVVVALVASSIPEGLLPAITIIFTVAMRRILKVGSLVRRMAAVESLGAASVICIDKTGTITEGKMRAHAFVTARGSFPFDGAAVPPPDVRAAMRTAVIGLGATVENPTGSPAAWRIRGSATEAALLRAAGLVGAEPLARIGRARLTAELPFDSSYKFAAACADGRMVVRGAPEILLARCTRLRLGGRDVPLTAERRAHLIADMLASMATGLRAVAVCERAAPAARDAHLLRPRDVRELTFLGAVLLHDPVRPETASLLAGAAAAGMRVVMVTGDHLSTAQAVARAIGLTADDRRAVDGARLDRMSDDALRAALPRITVFARVTPAQKLRIVQMFQKMGETVAVTGDGVNDAPALSAAEIGIALGSGTDVAKEASDIVLLDDNFRTILRSIEQGRFAFQNLRKATVYMIADDFSEMALFVGALALGLPLPLTVPQILWINIVESGFLNIGLALEPGEEAVLTDPPRRRSDPFFSRRYKIWFAAIAGIITVTVLPTYVLLLRWTGDIAVTRSMLLVLLSLESIFMTYVVRRVRLPALSRGLFANRWLNAAAVLSAALLVLPILVPSLHAPFSTTRLTLLQWTLCAVFAFMAILLVEAAKLLIITLPKDRALDAARRVR